MANTVETLVANAPITCPADKYYNFFKYDTNKTIEIFPTGYTGVEVLKGKEGVPGNVKIWQYIIGGIAMSVKVLTEVIDDATKTIKSVTLEGEVLQLYKTFNVILTVSEGLAKWTIEFEKATILSPPPELLYVPFLATLSTLVNDYLLIN